MLRVCNKCMTIYNDSSLGTCVLKKCGHGKIVDIDEFIYPYVKALNLEKSLPTDFSCSGHLYEKNNHGYISLNCNEMLVRIACYLRCRFPSYYSKSIPIEFLYKMIGLVYIRMLDNNNRLSNYEDRDHILEGIANVINDCLTSNLHDYPYDTIDLSNRNEIEDDRIKYHFHLKDNHSVQVQYKSLDNIYIEFTYGTNRTDSGLSEIPRIIIRMKPVSFENDDDIKNSTTHLSGLLELSQCVYNIQPLDVLLDKIFKKKYKLVKTQQGRKYKLVKRTHLTK